MSRQLGLALVASLATAACHSDAAAWRAQLGTPAVRRLAGSWQLELTASSADSTRHVLGQIALTLNGDRLSGPGGFDAPPLYFGTYDVDFMPFGFRIDVASDVPSVVATLHGDSLNLILEPQSPGAAHLVGAVVGDSVVGHWSVHQRAGSDAFGDFTLRRR